MAREVLVIKVVPEIPAHPEAEEEAVVAALVERQPMIRLWLIPVLLVEAEEAVVLLFNITINQEIPDPLDHLQLMQQKLLEIQEHLEIREQVQTLYLELFPEEQAGVVEAVGSEIPVEVEEVVALEERLVLAV